MTSSPREREPPAGPAIARSRTMGSSQSTPSPRGSYVPNPLLPADPPPPPPPVAKAEKADEGGGGGGGAARPAAPVLVLVLAPAKDEAARRAWGTGPKAAAVATAPAQRRGDSIPIPAIGGGEGGGAMGDLGAMGPAVAHTCMEQRPVGRSAGRWTTPLTESS